MTERQKGCVVVVDDEGVLVDVVCEMLEDAGLESVACPHGEDVYDCIQGHRPDVVILDLHMPNVDGAEIFRRLRESPETRAIPVIFFTAGVDQLRERLPDYREQGGHLLVKPFTEEQLLDTVERVRSVSSTR